MDIAGFAKVAGYLTHPLVLVGFVLMLVFGMHRAIVQSGLLPKVSRKDGGEIIKLILRYGFWLGMVLMLAGFALQFSGIGLSAWNSYMKTEQVRAVDAGKLAEKLLAPLQGELEEKNQQIKGLIEAVTALSEVEAPVGTINDALQALEQGDTAQARAVFAEVLRTREAEGQKANKEAAAAARHLGALAFLHNTEEALAAYQKAVALDPDNADGWNRLGHLLDRTGELDQAEQAFRRVLALGESRQEKEWQAKAYGGLGNVYQTRGELDRAEKMYRKSSEISEDLGRRQGMASAYGGLGIVYAKRNELDRAERMLRKSLEINQVLKHKEGIANDYGNLGRMYKTHGELERAEEMYRKSLEINQALRCKKGMAINYANLGVVYEGRGEFDLAERMYLKSLEISEALGLKETTAMMFGNLGLVYATRGEVDRAEEMHRKSLRLFQEMKHPNAEKAQRLLDELAQKESNPAQ